MNAAFHSDHSCFSCTIHVGGHELHYLKIGLGSKLVLAFHGYGNDAGMFQFLHHPDYTVLSFDLPFQGKSPGFEGAILQKQDLQELISLFMEEYGVSKIGLVGFSLGARACLCITEQMPQQVRNLVLIAPDGIRHNYFYQFLTGTIIGKFLFKSFVRFGAAFLSFFSALKSLRLLSPFKYKFMMFYIRTAEARQRLLDIWISTSKLIPSLQKIKMSINKKQIPVHILMGQHDQVIPLRNAKHFKGHSTNIHIHVFERGHNLMEFEEVKGTVAAWIFRTYQTAKN